MTKSRPSSTAAARAADASTLHERGLPPTRRDGCWRVARTSSTTYWSTSSATRSPETYSRTSARRSRLITGASWKSSIRGIDGRCPCTRTISTSDSRVGYDTSSLNMKRSSWASGSGYVPSCSIGFCVARTKKSRGRGWLWPSTVTVRSCMASSSAACVLGGVRLISSASSTSVNSGPRVNVNLLVWKSNRLVPRMSPGRRSGVNWMRFPSSPRQAANERTSSVLPMPGTPSSSTWPSASSAIVSMRSSSDCPITTRPTSRSRLSHSARTCSESMDHPPMPVLDGAGQLEHRSRGAEIAALDHLDFTIELRGIAAHAPPARQLRERLDAVPVRGCGQAAARRHFARHLEPEQLERLGRPGRLGDQLRRGSHQRGARGGRRRQRARRAESGRPAPEEEPEQQHGLDQQQNQREPQRCRGQRALEHTVVGGLVEHDPQRARLVLEEPPQEPGVIRAWKAAVVEEVGVRGQVHHRIPYPEFIQDLRVRIGAHRILDHHDVFREEHQGVPPHDRVRRVLPEACAQLRDVHRDRLAPCRGESRRTRGDMDEAQAVESERGRRRQHDALRHARHPVQPPGPGRILEARPLGEDDEHAR